MASFALVAHPKHPEAFKLALEAEGRLLGHGHAADVITGPGPWTAGEYDLAVSFGGDGTMLRTVHLAMPAGVPVMGVNLGKLGYLTDVATEDVSRAIELFLAGRVAVEERMTLRTWIRHQGAEPILVERAALNDVVLARSNCGHTIRVRAWIEDQPFIVYPADGLIISTPTGSTGYNLSAGGPVVSPGMEMLLMTPVSPHTLFDRTLVLPVSTTVRLELIDQRDASVAIDGVDVAQLHSGDSLICSGGPLRARLARLEGPTFHRLLRSKFGLNGG